MTIIKLKSADGVVLETDTEVAKCSGTIKDMLDQGIGGEESDEPVPLPKVNSTVLKKVLEWAEHHKGDPEPDDDESTQHPVVEVPEWDAEFLKVDNSTLFDLILASNYLDVKGLLKYSSKTLALMMKGLTPEQIREKFGIENDFTEAEKEEMRKEAEWCEEKK